METQPENREIRAFLQTLSDEGRADLTLKSYGHEMARFAEWFEQVNGEPFSAQTLTATDVRQYRQYLLDKKAAPATINRVLATLRTFTAWAVQVGKLPADPIAGIRGVKEQIGSPKWLDKKDQAKLERELQKTVNAAKTKAAQRQAVRDQAIVVLLLNTGLRVAELCALTLSDIQADSSKNRRKKKATLLVIRQGKGDKARTVPINTEAQKALDAWLALRPENAGIALFVGKRLEPLQPSGVQRLLAEYGRRAKVEVTPHTARHTFAKRLLESGVSLDQVAALMGHSSLDTTRIYTLPSTKDLAIAVARIGD